MQLDYHAEQFLNENNIAYSKKVLNISQDLIN